MGKNLAKLVIGLLVLTFALGVGSCTTMNNIKTKDRKKKQPFTHSLICDSYRDKGNDGAIDYPGDYDGERKEEIPEIREHDPFKLVLRVKNLVGARVSYGIYRAGSSEPIQTGWSTMEDNSRVYPVPFGPGEFASLYGDGLFEIRWAVNNLETDKTQFRIVK